MTRTRKVTDRLGVATDPGTSPALLEAMAADPSRTIRRALAARDDAPHLLAALQTDPASKVRAHAAQNPLADHHLLARDKSADVRMAAVQWGELPPDELQRLAHDRSANVRWLLAAWPSTPQAVLRVIA
ncbi:hypothetical protein [Nonomuraea rubra]|uniref:hypothetical protein n=1 Tax=Nonomuraea rubra TaxID=46180 RepID=UPI0033E536CC